jgi:HPt (histidine-containing phosphotransfer) domain-containing protein
MNTHQTPSCELVFDIEKLIYQFDDKAFALEIASHFVSSVPEYREELLVCLDQQDSKQTLSLAHRLRESAAAVKADRISCIASELESAAQENRGEHVQTLVSELLLEFDNFANAVRNTGATC